MGPFQFDVFLSYGWSGIPNQEDGDRRWVKKLKAVLQNELAANLGRAARIFLDVEQLHSGQFPPNLERALSTSALFLSVITPGAVREDSWCRWEIRRFLELAPAVLSNLRQLFVIRLREVAKEQMPAELRGVPAKDFLSEGVARLPFPEQDLDDPRTVGGRLARELAQQLAQAVQEAEQQVDKTFFLAAVSPELQPGAAHIANLLVLRDRIVLWGELREGEQQESFRQRVARQIRGCGWSLHFLDRQVAAAPQNWDQSPQVLQVKLAQERLRPERVAVLADPNSPPPEVYHELLSGPELLEAIHLRPIAAILRRLDGPAPAQSNVVASQVQHVSYRVEVLNASTAVSNAEVEAVCGALRKQVERDLAPAWGISADIRLLPAGAEPAAGSWLLLILDDSEYPGVPSYHTLTIEGLPLVKVFVRTARSRNFDWTMCASHELLEMLVDPVLNSAVLRYTNGARQLYVRQICDPCRDPQFAYRIDGILVSDFVFPAWFEDFRQPDSTPFDYGGHIHAPFGLLPGAVLRVMRLGAKQQRKLVSVPLDEPKAQPAKKNMKKRKRAGR